MFSKTFTYGFGVGSVLSGTVGYYVLSKSRMQLKADSQLTLRPSINLEPQTEWNDNWDGRKPLPEEKSPTRSRNLIFIRHGSYNVNGKEDNERILNSLGRLQAGLVGERLKRLDFPYEKTLITSAQSRAIGTSYIINRVFPEFEVIQDPLLSEGFPYPVIPSYRTKNPVYSAMHHERIESAFRKYFFRANVEQLEDSYQIFVIHANVIRYFLCRALQLPPEAWLRFSLHHCSITWLRIQPNGYVSARLIGDTGHMPKDLMTFHARDYNTMSKGAGDMKPPTFVQPIQKRPDVSMGG